MLKGHGYNTPRVGTGAPVFCHPVTHHGRRRGRAREPPTLFSERDARILFVEQETNGYGSSARRTCNGRERGRGQGYDEPVNRLSSEESERFRPMTERGDAGPDEVGDVRSFDDFVFEKRLRAGFGGEGGGFEG